MVAKTGMGSSAALVSSLVGAVLCFFGAACLPSCDGTPKQESGPGVNESLDLTHNLAQACHCVAQGKVSHFFFVKLVIERWYEVWSSLAQDPWWKCFIG